MISRRKTFGGLGNQLFQDAYIYAQARRGEIPDIYIQDEKYFKDYKDEIRALYGQGIEPIDMVSLHIRRGDYVNNPFYVDLTETDYYERAVELFPDDKFLVFCADRQKGSDDVRDMKWVADYLEKTFPNQKHRFELYQGDNEMDDFNTMSGCKGHIMANSSFSWWAAYVSGNKTACPKRWFSDGVQRISIPDNYILI